jgi:hypothetical protein
MVWGATQENGKVLTGRGDVHVLGQAFARQMRSMAEKWTNPRTFLCDRTLQLSWGATHILVDTNSLLQ